MATPVKKRDIGKKAKQDVENANRSSDHEDNFNDEQGKKIMVDFVGHIPEDSDFHGIKILLQQLFLKAHVNVGALAQYIISHNYVGSVVKQGFDDDDDEDDDENEDLDVNDVYGITSVINISHNQNEQCIQQLRSLLRELANDFANDSVNGIIKNLLENDSAPLGLIINERFVNIPTDISVPLLENLMTDMKRANSKNMPYDFQYYILISKLYKSKLNGKLKTTSNKKDSEEEPELFWSNQEEEIFNDYTMCQFEFAVDKESDTGLTGTWTEDDNEMIPYRRVMLFESSKLPTIIEKIKQILSN